MPVHAMPSAARRCKMLVFYADQLSHLSLYRALHALFLCCCSHACTTEARALSLFHFFFQNRLPLTCTRAAAGFADVCPRSASNTGYSHASVLTLTFPHSLMKWETETLKPSSSPQCLTAHMGLKCVPCLNVKPSLPRNCARAAFHPWLNTSLSLLKFEGIAKNGRMNATPNLGLLSVESTLANVASALLQRAGWLAALLRRSGSQTQP